MMHGKGREGKNGIKFVYTSEIEVLPRIFSTSSLPGKGEENRHRRGGRIVTRCVASEQVGQYYFDTAMALNKGGK